jgi:glycosyltransferase involved in cell wall biosynthesis
MTAGQSAFPEVVLEALASGTPLVSSSLPLLREILSDDCSALLSQPDDPPALAGNLRRIVGDPALGARLAAAAMKTLQTHFDPQTLADRYVRVLESAIQTYRRR